MELADPEEDKQNIPITEMNRTINPIMFLLFFLVILFLNPFNSFSQTIDNTSSQTADPVQEDVSMNSLFGGLGYGSNMIYLGSTISQNQPYGYTALTYGYRDKLYATVASVHLSSRDPFFAFNFLSVSYNHIFNSWFDIAGDASYYIVAPSLTDTLFGNFLFTNLTVGLDWRILYSKVSAGGLFSEENNAFIQFRNSRYFQTPEFSSKNLFFSFDPYINFVCGSLTTTKATDGTTIYTSPPYWKNGKTGQSGSNTEYSTRLTCLEIDFGIPISFNSNRFVLEAEPGYILPFYEDSAYAGSRGFLFTLSFYFRIF